MVEMDRLVVLAGRVWTPGGMLDDTAITIEEGRIVDLAPISGAGIEQVETLDARNHVVLPGLVDTHSHLREPGFTQKEDVVTGTQAAAMGGVTTTISMPNVEPPVLTRAQYENVMDRYADRSLVDFNLHPSGTDAAAFEGLAAAGALGFKIWMVEDTKRSYPHMPGLGVHDDGVLLEIFEAAAEAGLPLLVHPHNQSIMNLAEHRIRESGDRSPLAYGRAQRIYDGIVWDTAIQTLLRLQEAVGTRLHILHLVTKRSVDLVRAAKERTSDVTAEVNPFGLFLGAEDLILKRGPYVMGRLITPETKDALWGGLADGTIDVVGTDHAPHTKKEKEVGWEDMWKAPSGTPQLQDYLIQLLDVGVRSGQIDLDRLARVTSYNPARLFGLYPAKGTVEIGSDADLVVVDLEREVTFRNEDAVSKCGWTPYDGDTRVGAPIHTIVRGHFVMKDRAIVGRPGYGRAAFRVRNK